MPSLFPPSLVLVTPVGDSSSAAPAAQAHLMPFHIAYDGPAPVDRYMVQVVDDDAEAEVSNSSNPKSQGEQALRSSFRGRSLHSTRVKMPEGYVLSLLSVSGRSERRILSPTNGTASSSSSSSSAAKQAAAATAAADSERASKRAKLQAKLDRERVARGSKTARNGNGRGFAKFSMDDDEEDDEDGQGGGGWSDEEVGNGGWSDDEGVERQPFVNEVKAGLTTSPVAGAAAREEAEEEDVRPLHLSRQLGRDVLIWGADGRIDMGDDGIVRALGEYVGLRRLLAGVGMGTR